MKSKCELKKDKEENGLGKENYRLEENKKRQEKINWIKKKVYIRAGRRIKKYIKKDITSKREGRKEKKKKKTDCEKKIIAQGKKKRKR